MAIRQQSLSDAEYLSAVTGKKVSFSDSSTLEKGIEITIFTYEDYTFGEPPIRIHSKMDSATQLYVDGTFYKRGTPQERQVVINAALRDLLVFPRLHLETITKEAVQAEFSDTEETPQRRKAGRTPEFLFTVKKEHRWRCMSGHMQYATVVLLREPDPTLSQYRLLMLKNHFAVVSVNTADADLVEQNKAASLRAIELKHEEMFSANVKCGSVRSASGNTDNVQRKRAIISTLKSLSSKATRILPWIRPTSEDLIIPSAGIFISQNTESGADEWLLYYLDLSFSNECTKYSMSLTAVPLFPSIKREVAKAILGTTKEEKINQISEEDVLKERRLSELYHDYVRKNRGAAQLIKNETHMAIKNRYANGVQVFVKAFEEDPIMRKLMTEVL